MPDLSRRETEVAGLVAEGLTNREIAARLFISERTAEYHVEQIRNKLGVHSRQEITRPAKASPPNHLPPQLTSFVGRSRELETVGRLLKEARLVTVTGAGGSGKTRLALEVASRVLPGYRDGAWFVDLQSLQDASLLPAEVAAALGVGDLTRELVAAHMLVVLDNCEQVASACRDLVEDLLGACRDLKVLATSREPIHAPGEAVWPLQPLPAEEAVALFLDRARLAAPDVPLGAADPALVRGICEDLDGIPLAIELAAARAGVLSLRDIRERLKSRFRVLVAGAARAPRQRSLAATVGWSYDLLSEEEREAFRRLGVFAGGFFADSAQAVVGQLAGEMLDRLVERSLVVAERSPEQLTRYRMLVTMRDYARERLVEAGEEVALRAAHGARFTALAREAAGQLQGPDQSTWMRRIEDELDEYRAAMDWGLEMDPAAAIAIAGGLDWFWGLRGRVAEGRRVLAASLERAPEPTLERAHALIGAGWLARLQGDVETGRRHHLQSVEILRALDDPIELGKALVWNAEAAQSLGDWEAARRGWLEAVELLVPLGTSEPLAYAHLELAFASAVNGQPAEARRFAAVSLSMMVALGNARAVALTHVVLAEAALLEGGHDEARRELLECNAGLRAAGAIGDLIWPLEVGAALLHAEGATDAAVSVAAAAAEQRQATGRITQSDTIFAGMEEMLRQARAELGEAAYEAAWQRGSALGPEQAVDLVRVRTPS